MRTVLFASLVAALSLSAWSARADEVVYVDQGAAWTVIDTERIVTSDATFAGSHAGTVKDSPGPGAGVLATAEDFLYQFADPVEVKAAPHCHPARDGMLATADCDCTHC